MVCQEETEQGPGGKGPEWEEAWGGEGEAPLAREEIVFAQAAEPRLFIRQERLAPR